MEHICLILDVGKHMLDDQVDNIKNTPAYLSIEGIIQKKLFAESKTDIGLIYCGTNATDNDVYQTDSDAFQHISVVSQLTRVNWDLLKKLTEEIVSCDDNESDLLESIYVAANHLVNELNERNIRGKKRVIVFSNLESAMDFTQLESIESALKNESIELSVVSGRDLSDIDDEPSEKVSQTRLKNEEQLLKLSTDTGGSCYSFRTVLSESSTFETKAVTQRGWKVHLQVSDVFSLAVVGYLKVKQVRAPPFKSVYGGDVDATIEVKTTNHLNDASQTPVDPDDLIKGYKYGRSIVPCNEADNDSMKIEVEKSMKLIGFVDDDAVPHTLFTGDSAMLFVVDDDNHAAAFSSLVYAMYACKVVALVRRVYSRASSPRLGVLMPRIKSDHVSLVYTDVAFAEDIRTFPFPNLLATNRPKSAPGGGGALFNDKQLAAVDALMDHLMLVETPAEGKQKELHKPSSIRNPAIQYFYQCAQTRCFQPHQKLPELSDDIIGYLKPPADKLEGIEELIESIKENFPTKSKIDTSKKRSKADLFANSANPPKKLNLGDHSVNLDEMLVEKITEVGAVDPISDFIALLIQGRTGHAIASMKSRIWKLVNSSYMATFYPKAVQCLHELRKQSIEHATADEDFVKAFNTFLINMKAELKSSLSKKDFWALVVKEKINLISEAESIFSNSQSEVDKFLEEDDDTAVITNSDDEMSALFDDM